MGSLTLLENIEPLNSQPRQIAANSDKLRQPPLTTVNDCQLSPIEAQLADAMDELDLLYESQFQIDNMRVDFAFPDAKLVIECDGYDFHHTKDQRNSDTRRDRKLAMRKWQVMRFTGSDIHADSLTCALQIRYMIEQILARRSTAPYDEFYWCYRCDLYYPPDDWKPRTCPECGNEFSVAPDE